MLRSWLEQAGIGFFRFFSTCLNAHTVLEICNKEIIIVTITPHIELLHKRQTTGLSYLPVLPVTSAAYSQ